MGNTPATTKGFVRAGTFLISYAARANRVRE